MIFVHDQRKSLWDGRQLFLIAVGLLGTIALMSFLVAPLFREKLNKQFMLGARNQAFLTEYIAGMGTVKSLQMEPDIDKKYGGGVARITDRVSSDMSGSHSR